MLDGLPPQLWLQALPLQAAAGARQSCMCRCAETARPREGQMRICLRRREFIAGLGGAAALPLAARAQQRARMRRIAVFLPSAANDPESMSRVAALLQGLQELGWTNGRNVRIEFRWGAGEGDQYRKIATELIA